MSHSLKKAALVVSVALVLAPVLTATGAPEGDVSKAEKQNLEKIAQEWVKLGNWCIDKKIQEKAKLCLEKAEAAAPTWYGIKPFKDKVGSCEDGAKDADLKEWDKKLLAAGKAIASDYDKIIASGDASADPKLEERFEGYTFTALALDPDVKRWQAIIGQADAALAIRGKDAAKENARGMRYIDKAMALKPPEKVVPLFRKLVDTAATGRLVVKQASTHPLKYYFQLPPSFERKKDKKWPILVCDDGAGSNFYGIATNYVNKNFIVISPCTFGNTNGVNGNDGMMKKYREWYTDDVIKDAEAKDRYDWDEQGTVAAIKDVQQGFDGESRVWVTGFSGGGNLTYTMIFRHPDLLAGAVPTCANFFDRGFAALKGKFTADDLNFPIMMYTGEKDENKDWIHGKQEDGPGIEPETNAAEADLKELGYPNYKRVMLPGVGHSGVPEKVLEFMKPYLEGTKKRGDKLN